MKNIGIIGAGASGLYAAINLKNENNTVTILEKNNQIGKKILMTGNGRCNITNAKFYDEFLLNIVTNRKFLYSAFSVHDNYQTMDFFENQGLELVTEEVERVFPKSQKASDVVKFFENKIIEKNIKLITNANVLDIKFEDNFVVKTSDKEYEFDYLIIATGGLSYPNTGSTGDGYRFAKKFGHSVNKTYPSLVPIYIKDSDLNEVRAISLDNVKITIETDKRKFSETGSILINRNFISGPSVFKLSSMISSSIVKSISLRLIESDFDELDNEIINIIEKNPNKDISNLLKEIIPQALISVILDRAHVDMDKKANQIQKAERHQIVNLLLNFKLDFDRLGGFNQAVITKGGISVNEINPKTMESKIVPGLYFIGEVLDLDGLTGGFNLQLAFSTGHAAANSIKEKL